MDLWFYGFIIVLIVRENYKACDHENLILPISDGETRTTCLIIIAGIDILLEFYCPINGVS